MRGHMSGRLYVEPFQVGGGQARYRVCFGSVEIKTFWHREDAEAYVEDVSQSVRVG